MAKCEILYVTFARDLEWTRFSLESIRKYGSGFSGIKIVVPTWDVDKFLQFERYSTPECPVLIKNFLEYPGKGFVHHLAMKCYGDVFCPNADYILHMDPDCLFNESVSPQDYIKNGNPTIVAEPYSVVAQYFPGRFHWKSVTEEALKFDCPYETMCCHPSVYRKETYRGLRDYIESIHITPFTDFVIKQKNSFPMGFGEFNTIGSYALKFESDKYLMHDCGPARLERMSEIKAKPELKIGHPHYKLWQGWSYRGCDNYKKEIKEILG